jgi:hypothetical protein
VPKLTYDTFSKIDLAVDGRIELSWNFMKWNVDWIELP